MEAAAESLCKMAAAVGSLGKVPRGLVDGKVNEMLTAPGAARTSRQPRHASSCGEHHIFCRVCYETALSKEACCPTCKQPVDASKTLRGRAQETCGWTGKLAALAEHLAECRFAVTKCTHAGCSAKVPRKDVGAHEEDCVWRGGECERCGSAFTPGEPREHQCKGQQSLHQQLAPRVKQLDAKVKMLAESAGRLRGEVSDLRTALANKRANIPAPAISASDPSDTLRQRCALPLGNVALESRGTEGDAAGPPDASPPSRAVASCGEKRGREENGGTAAQLPGCNNLLSSSHSAAPPEPSRSGSKERTSGLVGVPAVLLSEAAPPLQADAKRCPLLAAKKRSQGQFLRAWAENHGRPFASHDEKEMLARHLDMTIPQVTNFFNNARKRWRKDDAGGFTSWSEVRNEVHRAAP